MIGRRAERLEGLHHGQVQAARASQRRQPAGPEVSVRHIGRILPPAARQMIAEDRDVQRWLVAGRPVGPGRPGGQVLDGHPGGEGGLGRGTVGRVEGDLVPKAAQRLG